MAEIVNTVGVADDVWLRAFAGTSVTSGAAQLFAFPHAGGSASYFYRLSRALDGDVQTFAVQYPGRQDRRHESFADSIAELADQLADVIGENIERQQPYAFFGHSMGSVVGFEVAMRLRERGRPAPAAMIASSRFAPSATRTSSFHRLADDQLLDHVVHLGGTDVRLLDDDEMVGHIVGVIRADYRLIEQYTGSADGVLECPIVAVVGDSDPGVSVVDADGWARHTSGEYVRRVLPGSHFYLDSNVDEVAAIVRRVLSGSLAS